MDTFEVAANAVISHCIFNHHLSPLTPHQLLHRMRNSSSTRLHVRHKIWVTFPFSVFLKQGQLNFQISLGFNFSSTFIFVLLKNVLNMENCRIHKQRPTKCVVISEMDVNQRKTLLLHFRVISVMSKLKLVTFQSWYI